MYTENTSPIINYVGTQVKLDGYFDEPIVDVVRKDIMEDSSVKELKYGLKGLVVDFSRFLF